MKKLALTTNIVGMRGHGKTLLATHLVSKESRLLVVDPFKQFEDGVICEDRVLFYRMLRDSSNFRVVYRSSELKLPEKKDRLLALDELLASCIVAQEFYPKDRRPRLVVLVDEVGHFCSSSLLPPNLESVMREARALNVRLVTTTQRPIDIHPMVRDLCDQWYIGLLQGRNSVLFFRDVFDDVEMLKSLPDPKVVGNGKLELVFVSPFEDNHSPKIVKFVVPLPS